MERILAALALALCGCDVGGLVQTGADPDDAGAVASDGASAIGDAGCGEACAEEVREVPASLVDGLSVRPYVEGSCVPATYPDWPHPALRCTYQASGNTYAVTVADPPPERVAQWIVDATRVIPALDALYARDHATWEAAVNRIARHTLTQSSRIFPLTGTVDEGYPYQFEKGVTSTCHTSPCYCRINSLSRADWCAYATATGVEPSVDACVARYGEGPDNKYDSPAWFTHCLDNHRAAWMSDSNDHYRAQALRANRSIATRFPDPATADPAGVLDALEAEYRIY